MDSNHQNKEKKGTLSRKNRSKPCPWGKGYDPKMQKIGTKMVGKDGKIWVVKETQKIRKHERMG
jgi:hypothetical protein